MVLFIQTMTVKVLGTLVYLASWTMPGILHHKNPGTADPLYQLATIQGYCCVTSGLCSSPLVIMLTVLFGLGLRELSLMLTSAVPGGAQL